MAHTTKGESGAGRYSADGMFTAAQCGLVILCDQALEEASLRCDEVLAAEEPPKSGSARRVRMVHGRRVKFDPFNLVQVREYVPITALTPLPPLTQITVPNQPALASCGLDEQAYDERIERYLAEAAHNTVRNTRPFRYGYSGPLQTWRHRQAHHELADKGRLLLRAAAVARESGISRTPAEQLTARNDKHPSTAGHP